MSNELYGELRVNPLPDEDVKARVCIIYTGGTIGMVPANPGNPSSPNLRPATLGELLFAVPELGRDEGIQLGLVSFHDPVDSSNVTSRHWLAIAQAIEEHYEQFDGFVILHGTDTMAYTTSALSFLLNNLAKPVVVTGSQLPICQLRTDAIQNLTAAVMIAGYEATDLPLIPEVVLCFMGRILRGCRATKVSASTWEGFDSPNFPPLGSIGEHIKVRKELLRPPADNKKNRFNVARKLATQIKTVTLNPAMTPGHFERDLKTEGIEGAILLTYGAGNMSSDSDFLNVVADATAGGRGYNRNGIQILNVTQCVEGVVEMGLYEASSGLLGAGVASGLDMTYEAALAKMYWAITAYPKEFVRSALQISQRGEQSQDLFDLSFDPGAANKKSAAADVITVSSQLPGTYKKGLLQRSHIRIQGLGYTVVEKGRESTLRIFVNERHATVDTSPGAIQFAGEVYIEDIPQSGSLLLDVTRVAGDVIEGGLPVTLSLVGANIRIWCRSIHMALYTET